jgi:Na+-driven multidrug efflux pump
VLGVGVLLVRSLVAPLFTGDPAVRSLLADVLLVVALSQPVNGVVFTLDGVLIGAGDGRYLARAGVVTLVVFLPLAAAVRLADGGLVALWWAFTGFMLARLASLLWRERADRWLVTGAVVPRRCPPATPPPPAANRDREENRPPAPAANRDREENRPPAPAANRDREENRH